MARKPAGLFLLDDFVECCIIKITWAGRKTRVQPTRRGNSPPFFWRMNEKLNVFVDESGVVAG